MPKWYEYLFGKPEKNYAQPQWEQLNRALQGPGAGGAFGDTADYYRNLMSNNSADAQAFEAPLRRQFQEDIIPGIAEQFAGMGSGGLSSGGFKQAGVRAGTDLAERLAAIRSGLRMQGAQGLSQLGQFGIQSAPFRPATGGLFGNLAPGIGAGLGMAFGGPAGGFLGQGIGSLFSNQSSPSISPPQMTRGNQSFGGGHLGMNQQYRISS